MRDEVANLPEYPTDAVALMLYFRIRRPSPCTPLFWPPNTAFIGKNRTERSPGTGEKESGILPRYTEPPVIFKIADFVDIHAQRRKLTGRCWLKRVYNLAVTVGIGSVENEYQHFRLLSAAFKQLRPLKHTPITLKVYRYQLRHTAECPACKILQQ